MKEKKKSKRKKKGLKLKKNRDPLLSKDPSKKASHKNPDHKGSSYKDSNSNYKSSNHKDSNRKNHGSKDYSRKNYNRKDYGRIDFLGKTKYFAVLSILLTVLSLAVISLNDFNYGIDFAGGTEIQIQFDSKVKTQKIRDFIRHLDNKDLDDKKATVQSFGSENEFLVRIESLEMKNTKEEDKKEISSKKNKGSSKNLSAIKSNTSPESHHSLKSHRSLKNNNSFKNDNAHSNLNNSSNNNDETNYKDVNKRTQKLIEDITKGMKKTFKEKNPVIRRVDSVGPQVGSELKRNGLMALFYSLLIILIYIGLRFDYKYAPSAVLCLFHDVIITLGIFSLFNLEVNIQTMAAILTIIGYSLNDTIVNFDRIRENVTSYRDSLFKNIINRSLNEVLSRTLLTSITTLLALITMYLISGGVIKHFAFALGIGVIIGTYSSIYVASPLLLLADGWQKRRHEP